MIGILSFHGLTSLSSWRLYSAIREAEKEGFIPLVYQADPHNEASCLQSVHAMVDSRVDGVLILSPSGPTFNQRHLEILQKQGVAVTCVNTPWLKGVSCYLQNKRKGFEALGTHLLEQGYRSITLMSTRFAANERKKHNWHVAGARDGFRAVEEAARQRGLQTEFRIHEIEREALGGVVAEAPDIHPLHVVGYQAMWEMIRSNQVPDALMCQVDNWALGALRACEEAGISVPGEMAITGFEGDPAGSVGYMPLTTVAHPVDEISQLAIAELVAMMQKGLGPQKRFVEVDGRLIIRRSSVREGRAKPHRATRQATSSQRLAGKRAELTAQG